MRDNPEHRIHTRAVAYLRLSFVARYGLGKESMPFFHAANESNVPVQYRKKLSDLGVVPGVSDLVIVWPTRAHWLPDVIGDVCYPGAALEIKAPKGRLSAAQRGWLRLWADAGFATACTRGHRDTAETLQRWGYLLDEYALQWVAWAMARDREAL
jgi:hypothetical protein